jgi:putative membrane protein
MKRHGLSLALGLCALLSLGSAAAAQDQPPSPQAFVAQASAASVAKVEAAKLALQKSESEDVQSFAQQVIDDHTKAASDLKALARDKNLQAYDEAAPVKASKNQLLELRQDSFDAAYARNQVKTNEEAVAFFSRAVETGDPDVQDFARNTLPVLQRHLEMARELEKAHPSY